MALSSIYVLYHILSAYVTSIDDLQSFSVTIDSGNTADTVGTVNLVIWFNFSIYQYTLPGSNSGQTYTAYKQSPPYFTTLGTSNCYKSEYNNIPESKILVENSNTDAVAITSARITSVSGIYYQWNSICIESGSVSYSTGKTCNSNCHGCSSNSMGIYGRLCIDSQSSDCGPSRQVVYFDTQYPNQAISNANWADGSSVYPDINTCEPTPSPTVPTRNPSKYPTYSPSIPPTNPTYNPSTNPTLIPTVSPTKMPTVTPSNNPSMIPSNNPSKIPSNNPSNIPSNNPSNMPTFTPTNKPSKNPTIEGAGHVEEKTTDYDINNTGSNDASDALESEHQNIYWVYILVAVCICLCCILLLIFMRIYVRRKKRHQFNTNESNVKEHMDTFDTKRMQTLQSVESKSHLDSPENGTVSNGIFGNNLMNNAVGNGLIMNDIISDMNNNNNENYVTPMGPNDNITPMDNINKNELLLEMSNFNKNNNEFAEGDVTTNVDDFDEEEDDDINVDDLVHSTPMGPNDIENDENNVNRSDILTPMGVENNNEVNLENGEFEIVGDDEYEYYYEDDEYNNNVQTKQ